MNERLLLRPNEVAQLLGIGRSKTYEMLAAGIIPSVRIGASVGCRRTPSVPGLRNRPMKARKDLIAGPTGRSTALGRNDEPGDTKTPGW